MDLETRTVRRIFLRIVPFIMVCYFIAYFDRVNISFASLTMNNDLGMSSTAYGFGAGVFFVSCFMFEVPSNLFLARVGARRWIARIMVSWAFWLPAWRSSVARPASTLCGFSWAPRRPDFSRGLFST